MLLIALFVFLGLWVAVQFMGRKIPAGLGVHEGSLAECPDTPNCVCSECKGPGEMPPLEFSCELRAVKPALLNALHLCGIDEIQSDGYYIHAVAVTPIMRFRDDLEFLIQPEVKRIQFRSASRLGRSDLGKNRQRLQQIFALLDKEGIRPRQSRCAGPGKKLEPRHLGCYEFGSAPLRKGPPIKAILSFLAQIHEQDRNVVTGVTIAVALHHDAGPVNLFSFGGKQIDGHLGPLRDWFIGPKLDTVRADFDGLRGKSETSLRALHMQGLKDSGPIEFASAHIG
jgi:uncharacterized protein (DUF1499 family)